jgi:hypothetical protein
MRVNLVSKDLADLPPFAGILPGTQVSGSTPHDPSHSALCDLTARKASVLGSRRGPTSSWPRSFPVTPEATAVADMFRELELLEEKARNLDQKSDPDAAKMGTGTEYMAFPLIGRISHSRFR